VCSLLSRQVAVKAFYTFVPLIAIVFYVRDDVVEKRKARAKAERYIDARLGVTPRRSSSTSRLAVSRSPSRQACGSVSPSAFSPDEGAREAAAAAAAVADAAVAGGDVGSRNANVGHHAARSGSTSPPPPALPPRSPGNTPSSHAGAIGADWAVPTPVVGRPRFDSLEFSLAEKMIADQLKEGGGGG
jgi:hypothetical protein